MCHGQGWVGKDDGGTFKPILIFISPAIERDGESVPWAVAGSSVTLFLSGIEMIFLRWVTLPGIVEERC